MIPKHRPPTHPGEVLLKEFLEPLGITQVKLAQQLGISFQRINTIVNGKRGVTAETAWLLARYYRTTPQFWMNLQAAYYLYQARREITNREFAVA